MNIDPDDTAQLNGMRYEIRLKDPYSYTRGPDCEVTELTPMVEWMGWTELATTDGSDANHTDACTHEETACVECIDTWGQDYHIKLVLPDGREFGLNDVPGMTPLQG